MASNKARLAQWISQMVYGSTASDGLQCRMIKVKHLSEATDSKVAGVADFFVDVANFSAELVTEQILEAMQDDANACGGVQRYSVRAYYGATTDKVEPRGGRFTCRVRGEKEDMDDDAFDSESKDMKGHVAQMMRHNEAMVRAMLAGSAEASRTMVSIVGHMSRMMETQQTTVMNLTEQLQQSLDRKAEREVASFKAHAIERRKDAVFGKLALLMPLAINRLAGKTVVQEEQAPELHLLKGFINSLTKTQLEALSGVLGPEQQMLVLELCSKYADTAEEPKQLGDGKKAAE